jgi:hypothetical protein
MRSFIGSVVEIALRKGLYKMVMGYGTASHSIAYEVDLLAESEFILMRHLGQVALKHPDWFVLDRLSSRAGRDM